MTSSIAVLQTLECARAADSSHHLSCVIVHTEERSLAEAYETICAPHGAKKHFDSNPVGALTTI